MSVKLHYVDPETLLLDAFRLGRKVYLEGFRPRHAISIWRGGTPVGLGVDAFFRARGVTINHTTIATDSYTAMGRQGAVTVKNLDHLVQVVCPEDDLLIVDDVYESGNTIGRVVEVLREKARANAPRNILVATVHRKPGREVYTGLPVVSLHDIPGDTWIDYPHELADLLGPDDPDEARIRRKGEDIWQILQNDPEPCGELPVGPEGYAFPGARELHLDCLRLGMAVGSDPAFHPDFLVALWPGGVIAGIPVHEVYKYLQKKRGSRLPPPDHISVNTSPTRSSYQTAVIGLNYLEERINRLDNVLIVDTTFRAGRLVGDVVRRLKEVLRRNLDHRRVRVACVYYNPNDDSTWTVRPSIRRPDYHVRQVHGEVIDPTAVHKLPNAPQTLRRLRPELWEILYGEPG